MQSPENELVFVEVKARKDETYGYPEDFVTKRQQGVIKRTAEDYIFDHNYEGEIRFDIIAILLTRPPELTHFEDAF